MTADEPNELLLDVMVFPDYGCIQIGDAASWTTVDPPGGGPMDGGFTTYTDYGLYVYTMSTDEAVHRNQDVRVRVYRGTDDKDLGALIFDRDLMITSPPQLAVNQTLSDEPGEGGGLAPLSRAGSTRIRIYTKPPKDADEVNILVP
ncbi:hypothetical protein A5722_06135 [Mycobacterium vulneris]|uniref:hypothetical protein n=1 Tax=Mycolicibacterium porcinum TaxID=39693 RepID=UPI00080AF7C8|nr:hypothetical protein [Mycolicibacterium porcinum]OCB58907.1 hypothetical protein A5722_06135 [Mycolicibacterium vulneris]OCB65314.1 hypothetical protein A5729_16315 [Mycolicibacterium vulneris]ODR25535.1 hypothetical protein BHQ19_11790 [Mycolicibacterium porcinum]